MSGRRFSPVSTKRSHSRLGLAAFFTVLALLAAEGCDSPTDEGGSVLGEIEVTVMSEGPAFLPDSLVILLNGDVSGSMAPNGVYMIPFLPPADYEISLRDEWENCWMGLNARTVTVEARKTSGTTFLVRCQ